MNFLPHTGLSFSVILVKCEQGCMIILVTTGNGSKCFMQVYV